MGSLFKGLFLLWLIWGWIFNRMLLFVVLIIEFLIATGEALYGQPIQALPATNGKGWTALDLAIAAVTALSTVSVTLFWINQQLHGEIRNLTKASLEFKNSLDANVQASKEQTAAYAHLSERFRDLELAVLGLKAQGGK